MCVYGQTCAHNIQSAPPPPPPLPPPLLPPLHLLPPSFLPPPLPAMAGPLVVGAGLSSQSSPDPCGDLAGEAWSLPGVCRGSVTMMGDTPSELLPGGLVHRVSASFGRADPRSRGPQSLVQSDATVINTFVWGGAQEPQSGFLDDAGGLRRGGGGADQGVRAGASDPGVNCESCRPFRASGCGADPGTMVCNCAEDRILSVDVPALYSDKLQQSMCFDLQAPQIQFIDDIWTFPLCSRDMHPQRNLHRPGAVLGQGRCAPCCATTVVWFDGAELWRSRSCSSLKVVGIPVVTQRWSSWSGLSGKP